MQNAIFDEHKGVYRVNNADGTFDTYSPAQWAEKNKDVITETSDEEVANNEQLEEVTDEEVTEYDGPTAKYKLLEVIPVVDQEGNETRVTEVGSIQEVPTELGEYWVKKGWAVAVVEEEKPTGLLENIKNIIK